jgi:deoxyribodipyrimidine photo-lyase
MSIVKYNISLFIFRRDLRLQDNIGLIAALKNSNQVIPCFIFDPRQCERNPYKSDKALQFMIESIKDLQQQLSKRAGNLYLFHGICEEIVEKIIREQKIEALFLNKDYTPFSSLRDDRLAELCQKFAIDFHAYDDALLLPPEETLKLDGSPYKVFTAFYNKANKIKIAAPADNHFKNYYQRKIKSASNANKLFETILPKNQSVSSIKGGRREGLKKLLLISKLQNYALERDYPSEEATSLLSPYLKFTTCSIREIYHAIKHKLADPSALLRQLYWRDFYTMIAYYYPHVFGQAFRSEFNCIHWNNNKKVFKKWCNGQTGFPIVDAGMRQLNQTGYMHNRVRLLAASLLVKDLHINWLWGEKYFARQLIDYDPAVNNGNWQWVAGTGTDAQPYFRIFNPWRQQLKFDPECLYIKKWLPELKHLDKKIIHNWYKTENQQQAHYPPPCVDHEKEAQISKRQYRLDKQVTM